MTDTEQPLDAPRPSARRRVRLSDLDTLRFVAAFAVMLYHYTYAYSSPANLPWLQKISRHGYMGVEVFFVISGFVVLWSAHGRAAGSFVRARILRLYPEFWICVLASGAVFMMVPGGFGESLSLQDIGVNLSMLAGFLGTPYVDGVYWTLSVELKFYGLLWALILLRQVGRIEGWLFVWLALSALASVVPMGYVVEQLTLFPYGSFFAAGGLFYLVFDSGWTRARAAGLMLALGLCSWHAVGQMGGFVNEPHITPAAKVVAVGVVVATFLFFSVLKERSPGAGFVGVAAAAGALTYPLYLLHNVGKELFLSSPDAQLPRPLLVLMAMTFSMVVSYVAMRLGTGIVRAGLRAAIDAVTERFPSRARPKTAG